MRNLTIKRHKSFVGCLGKMKVYIEDSLMGELEINGISCRKLGELKNGEEKTFLVGESAARVFVIADKLSKNYCNEFYPLPEGEEDVFLAGKNHFNPAAGNPFRFDGVTDETVLKNRKKGGKIGTVIFILAIAFGVAIGSLISRVLIPAIFEASPKTFSDAGIEITLTDAFEKTDDTGDFDLCYQSKTAVVQMFREAFSDGVGMEDWTLEEYAEVLIEVNEMDAEVGEEDGLVCFSRTMKSGNKNYHYFSVVLKGNDEFWYVEFVCVEKNFEAYKADFIEWAKSIRMD
jgi:hypothetical protein